MLDNGPAYRLNGHVVRYLAAEANMTIGDLAAKAGVTRSHLSRLVCGRCSPTASTRRKLMSTPPLRGRPFDDLFVEIQIESCSV